MSNDVNFHRNQMMMLYESMIRERKGQQNVLEGMCSTTQRKTTADIYMYVLVMNLSLSCPEVLED